MNKTLMSQYLTMQTRLSLFCQVQVVVSFCSFTTVTGAPVRIASTSISLVFLISNGNVKMFLKTTEMEKINTERLYYYPETN